MTEKNNPASAVSTPRPSTVILECPKCGELGESDAHEVSLVCPECGQQWTRKRLLTADETIAQIRGLLNEHQDASRRAFYNPKWLLRDIAAAVDAYPDPPIPAAPLAGDK